MAESQPFELGKGLKKALCQPGETLGSLLKTVVRTASVVVDGVVATPENAVVSGEPVVVELILAVGEALAVAPTDALGMGSLHVV
jgi:hypothetical protein